MGKYLATSLITTAIAGAFLGGGLSSSAFGASDDTAAQGTTESLKSSSIAPALSIPAITPSKIYTNAQFASSGVGLRNRSGGVINISGVAKPVKEAFLYWAVITTGTPPDATKKVSIQRTLPKASASKSLIGEVIGIGDSPCWTGNTTTVYRASVPLSVANGAGSYQIKLSPGASGKTDGSDPWQGTAKAPLMEGASLVIVGTAKKPTVSIYDKGLAGNTFSSSLSYTLSLPVPVSGSVWIDNIGADGQLGSTRTALYAKETTTINGVLIAGPGSTANDSDWNGAIAGVLPQLWDDTGHTIDSAVSPGTTSLAVSINSPSDCLVPVANIVAEGK